MRDQGNGNRARQFQPCQCLHLPLTALRNKGEKEGAGMEISPKSTGEIGSREEFVRFVYSLEDELRQHPEDWDNKDLATFLSALAAWLSDAHGYYRNLKLDVSADVPSWRLFADSLLAARVYD